MAEYDSCRMDGSMYAWTASLKMTLIVWPVSVQTCSCSTETHKLDFRKDVVEARAAEALDLELDKVDICQDHRQRRLIQLGNFPTTQCILD